MKPSSTRIVFFGNERLATGVSTDAPVLSAIIGAGYDVCAVVANHHEAGSRTDRRLEIEAVAEAKNIPVLLPARLSDISSELAALGADIGVLVAYGRIVSQDIIDLFPRGIINLHPSLLPLHRGPIPIEGVMLSGEPVTGVSIMQLTSEMDAGPIWAQQSIKLSGKETKQELANRLVELGSELLEKTLPTIVEGQMSPSDQIGVPSLDGRLSKADGTIIWTRSAEVIERQIRAYLGWPGSRTTINGSQIIITSVSVITGSGRKPGKFYRTEGGDLAVSTRRGDLVVNSLKPAGRNEMTGRAWLAGHPIAA